MIDDTTEVVVRNCVLAIVYHKELIIQYKVLLNVSSATLPADHHRSSHSLALWLGRRSPRYGRAGSVTNAERG